jgi:hypothetical protein
MIRIRFNRSPMETNMRKTPLAIVGFLVAALALAPQASAQPRDGYYDGYYYAPYPPAFVVVPAPFYPPAPYYAPPSYYGPPAPAYGGPRYGYVPPAPAYYAPPEPPPMPLRPRSCGKYHYWTGEYCADARYERPYVGRKWSHRSSARRTTAVTPSPSEHLCVHDVS